MQKIQKAHTKGMTMKINVPAYPHGKKTAFYKKNIAGRTMNSLNKKRYRKNTRITVKRLMPGLILGEWKK